MFNRIKLVLILAVSFSFAPVEFSAPVVGNIIAVQTAEAQSQRRSLFQILRDRRREFRARQRQRSRDAVRSRQQRQRQIRQQQAREQRARQQRAARQQQNSTGGAASGSGPETVVVKAEDAKKILVVGDFIASGIARELERVYSESKLFKIVSKTSAASGIVRYDVVNWESEIPRLMEEHEPVAVVTLLGMNDRQAFRMPDRRIPELSEPWMTEYRARVSSIAKMSRDFSTPMLWVGLPPVRFSKMNRDYLTFNEVYRTTIASYGGAFVDVWDGFTNEEGKFVSAGPDINGQIVRLRDSKGINMTRAGSRKMAFYVDQELRKLGISPEFTEAQIASIGSFNPNPNQITAPQYDPAQTGTTFVMSLGAANPATSQELEGGSNFLESKTEAQSASFDLVEHGVSYQPQNGRIDANWGLSKQKLPEYVVTDEQKGHQPDFPVYEPEPEPEIEGDELSEATQ